MSRRLLLATQPAIGHFVRDLRQQTGLSQEKFAAYLGVSFQAVNHWENGRATPSPMAIEKLQKQVKKLGDRGTDLLAKHFTTQQT
jgi:putative transcriptional regulator